ncbi:MAG: ABC transporter ATP-binding protein [Oscillospiraceae bacterium]|nr:ABC transporter ATP-binding protein [Oscillospiraceae bacterium]
MQKLFIHLKPYRRECVLGPLLKLAEATLELFVPLIVAAVIDRGIGGADRGYIIGMSLLLVGLGLLGLVFSVTAQYFSARAAVGFVTRLRHALYAHVQRFPYATLDRVGIPTLITRMSSDMNQVQTGLNLTLRLLLRSPFVVFGAMIMAFTIDASAALWFVAAIPVLAVVVFGVMLLTMPMFKQVQERLDQVLGSTRENLNGVRVLRAFRKEEAECRSFEAQNAQLTSMQQKVGRVSALMNPLTYIIVNLAVILLIRTGALRVQAGILTQGAVVALYNYMSQILVELIKLANLIINLTKALACGKRIQSILDIQDEEIVDKTLPGGDCHVRVEFDRAALRYQGAAGEALSGLSLRAMPGQVIGVIGGTGSGKSTLVNLIPRFYDVTQGRVLVDGADVRSQEPAALRRKIAIVPQKAVLFRGSIRDNLLWGAPEPAFGAAEDRAQISDEALLSAVETAQAAEVVAAKGGLDGQIEQFGRNLSGGQRQRLTIARALVRRPEILILDDSSSALDFATDAALRKALRGLEYQPTVFLVSQRTTAVRHADQIVVLDEGKVVGLGTHDELMDSCPVYREIHESQFRKEAAQ